MTGGPFHGGPMDDDLRPAEPANDALRAAQPRFSRPLVFALAGVLAAGVAGLWLGTRQRAPDTGPSAGASVPMAAEPRREPVAQAESSPGDLYFPGADGRLYGERRDLPVGTPAERARALVEGLLLGPSAGAASGLRPPLPAGTRIESVYLLATTAVLDLRPPEIEEADTAGPPTPADIRRQRLDFGSKQELLALYSLVNTVILGVEGVDSVQILWGGRQPQTFAGHVDTTRPLVADPSYIASR